MAAYILFVYPPLTARILEVRNDNIVFIAAGAVVGNGDNRGVGLALDLLGHGFGNQRRAAESRTGLDEQGHFRVVFFDVVDF